MLALESQIPVWIWLVTERKLQTLDETSAVPGAMRLRNLPSKSEWYRWSGRMRIRVGINIAEGASARRQPQLYARAALARGFARACGVDARTTAARR